jgi:hypothetical protein
MTTEKEARPGGGKDAKSAGDDKKKRLAVALRRNLAKRKDTKEAKIGDNPDRE